MGGKLGGERTVRPQQLALQCICARAAVLQAGAAGWSAIKASSTQPLHIKAPTTKRQPASQPAHSCLCSS